MARGKRRSKEFATWLIPDFPCETRAKFTGLCKILGRSLTDMVEEAISEWTANHAEEMMRILQEEKQYLEQKEKKVYRRKKEVSDNE